MLFFLTGCGDKIDLDEPEPAVVADLGDPWVGIVAAVSPGYLRSTCTIGIELYDVETQALAAEAGIEAQGREWTGVALDGVVQYTATGSWDDCTTTDLGTGTFESTTFSGQQGDFFLFRYDGVTAAFETLVQREDFEGGVALVTFAEGADVQAVAEAHGLEAEVISSGSLQYELTWSDTTPVGEVLGALSPEDAFVEGQPVWIRQPDWW